MMKLRKELFRLDINPKLCGRIFFVIKGRDVSGKIMRFIVRLKRIPRFFVVWHGESSVGIILSELIIPFFRLFFKDEKCKQKHAEFISEFCVFLFALSIGKFGRMHKNILMRSCLYDGFFIFGFSLPRCESCSMAS